MDARETLMRRCLQLARLGAGSTAPNPMVGAVLARGGEVLAEGWHRAPGTPHAERACLDAWGSAPLPSDAVLHVSLEPCAHQGRTPPCADLLIARGVRRVAVAHHDPYPAVNGKGIERLRSAGVQVEEGMLADEARWMNRRFITSVEQGRPYIILKWAQSRDGFLDRHPREGRGSQRISGTATDTLVHRWRSEEQAIAVGSRTAVNDDPRLDARHVGGRQPLRVAIDRANAIPAGSRILDGSIPTLLFTASKRADAPVEQVLIGEGEDPIGRMIAELHRRTVRSLIVEGGAGLLGHLIRRGLWDEARVIHGQARFGMGTPAPAIGGARARRIASEGDRIDLIVNTERQPAPRETWPW